MSRLPVPGSDVGTWGSILNDFLGVAHNSDGTLKTTLDAVPKAAADVDINSHKLTNVTDPTNAQDAATKNYVDNNGGGSSRIIATPSTAYAPGAAADEDILADATGGPFTVTLPTAVGNLQEYTVNKKDATANAVTVATTGGQTINGSASVVISIQNVSITVFSNGSNWYIK